MLIIKKCFEDHNVQPLTTNGWMPKLRTRIVFIVQSFRRSQPADPPLLPSGSEGKTLNDGLEEFPFYNPALNNTHFPTSEFNRPDKLSKASDWLCHQWRSVGLSCRGELLTPDPVILPAPPTPPMRDTSDALR